MLNSCCNATYKIYSIGEEIEDDVNLILLD